MSVITGIEHTPCDSAVLPSVHLQNNVHTNTRRPVQGHCHGLDCNGEEPKTISMSINWGQLDVYANTSMWRAGPTKWHWSNQISIKYIEQSGVTYVNEMAVSQP